MKIAITACIYNRPYEYGQVLNSYREVRGFSSVPYIPVFDKGYHHLCKIIMEERRYVKAAPIYNENNIGINHNTWKAINAGFKDPSIDAIIHAEDDLMWSSDTLEYFIWALNEFKNDADVFTIGAHNANGRENDVPRREHHLIYKLQKFTPWVWATWRDRYQDSIARCHPLADPSGWDFTMNNVCRGDRVEVRPAYSRTKHIGVNGVHVKKNQDWVKAEASEKRDWAGKDDPVGTFHCAQ